MASPVSLGTLITRVRQRWNGEGDNAITDWEITDSLNVSFASEVYDLLRQAVGDQYYRAPPYILTIIQGVQTYNLPGDFLSLLSVDVWTSTTGQVAAPGAIGASTLKVNARRYFEWERNMWQQALLGWSAGATALYTLNGQQITFQPTPVQSFAVQLNYVPISKQLGGGPNGTTGQPCNYSDQWDDVNGWSELAVLDAASKCCLKKNRLDMVQAFASRQSLLRTKVASVLSLRHAGEPERVAMPWTQTYGDGWTE